MILALILAGIVLVSFAGVALASWLLGSQRLVAWVSEFPYAQGEWLFERLVRARPVRGLPEQLPGALGTVAEPFQAVVGTNIARGRVLVHGESWSAAIPVSQLPRVALGSEVVVERVQGLTLEVRPRS